jgi:ketosteroid isomerase-like protein
MGENPNVALLRDRYSRWHDTRGGSLDHWMDILADDFELESMAGGRPGVEFSAPRSGKDEVMEYLSGLVTGWEMDYFRVDQFIADGDTVVMLGSTAWTNRATGKRAETRKADVWTFRDGKATSFLELFDSHAVIAAATAEEGTASAVA